MEWVFWLLALGMLAYEAFALYNHTPGDTISEIIWRLSQRPLIPFALGVLMGHLVWQSCA